MEQIFSNTTLTVNQLIEKIDTGELGLPELQGPFIWKDTKVRDLFDSMMRGYPIGYLMLWECPTLEKKKTIGIDVHSYESPRQVIIDGQQRLTSLYAVMKGKAVINSKYDEKSIVISYCPLKNKFEVGSQPTKADPEWIYNISDVFITTNITKLIIGFIKKLDEYINKTVQRIYDKRKGSSYLHIGPPKTKTSARVIPVPSLLMNIIKKFYTENPNHYFLTGKMKPTEPRTYRQFFTRFLKRNGLQKVKFHEIRHTFAVRAIEIPEFDIKSLSEILGHKNVSFTLNVYGSANLQQKVKCMNLLNDLL